MMGSGVYKTILSASLYVVSIAALPLLGCGDEGESGTSPVLLTDTVETEVGTTDTKTPPTPDGSPDDTAIGDTTAACDQQHCPARESGYPGGCWPEATDCSSVHANPDGTWVACNAGEQFFVDQGGVQACCAADTEKWCPPESGFPGRCLATSVVCSNVRHCGTAWGGCGEDETSHCGGDGAVYCCGGETPTWCLPPDATVGFCAQGAVDCSQAKACDGSEWAACSQDETAHCTSDGTLACCGDTTPVWCPPEQDFPGGCYEEQIACETLTLSPDGSYEGCLTTETVGWDTGGHLVCCGPEEPKLCPLYSGLDASYDGSQCLPANTDCDTLAKQVGQDGWAACLEGDTAGLALDGNLICCSGETPTLCPAGVNAYDGDAASQASSTTFPPTNSCVGQCNKDELCSSDGSSEFPPTKCKQPANELCNQCVATPKAYPLSYAGGCWPAGQDCSRLYLCGETYQACSQASCYCWMGSLFANW